MAARSSHAGADLEGKSAEAIPEKVWQAGVLGVSVQLNAYLAALYNPRGGDQETTKPGRRKRR